MALTIKQLEDLLYEIQHARDNLKAAKKTRAEGSANRTKAIKNLETALDEMESEGPCIDPEMSIQEQHDANGTARVTMQKLNKQKHEKKVEKAKWVGEMDTKVTKAEDHLDECIDAEHPKLPGTSQRELRELEEEKAGVADIDAARKKKAKKQGKKKTRKGKRK